MHRRHPSEFVEAAKMATCQCKAVRHIRKLAKRRVRWGKASQTSQPNQEYSFKMGTFQARVLPNVLTSHLLSRWWLDKAILRGSCSDWWPLGFLSWVGTTDCCTGPGITKMPCQSCKIEWHVASLSRLWGFAQQIWHVLKPSEMEQDLWSSRNPMLGQDGIFKQTEQFQWNEAFWDDWKAKGSILCPLEVWLYTVVGKGLLTNLNFFILFCWNLHWLYVDCVDMFPPRIYGFQLQMMERSKIKLYVFWYYIYTLGMVFCQNERLFPEVTKQGTLFVYSFFPLNALGSVDTMTIRGLGYKEDDLWLTLAWIRELAPAPGSMMRICLVFFGCLCFEWNISRGNVVKVGKSWISLLRLHVVFLDSLLYWLHTCNGTRCTSSKKASA